VRVVKVGEANPKFRMGFVNDFVIHDFTLHTLLDWQYGGDILNLTKLLYDFGGVTKDFDTPISGSSETVGQRRLRGFGQVTKNWIESASFLKLREIALTYNLPYSVVGGLWRGARYARFTGGRPEPVPRRAVRRVRPGSQQLRQPADRAEHRRRTLPAEPQFLVQRGHRLLTRRPEETAMRTLKITALTGLLLASGCNTLDVPDLNNPGQDELENHPTRAGVLAVATGMLFGTRVGMSTQNGYIMELGILGRESYNLDPADPRFVTELLVGPLDGGSGAFGGNLFAQPYADIRAGNIALRALAKLPASAMTTEEIEATTGFVQTIQALDFLKVISTRDDLGAPIRCGHRPGSSAGPDCHQGRGIYPHREPARLGCDPPGGRRQCVSISAQ
jgi:hypothetical protein